MEDEPIQFEDLGDAAVETKQGNPLGHYVDSYWGHGTYPG